MPDQKKVREGKGKRMTKQGAAARRAGESSGATGGQPGHSSQDSTAGEKSLFGEAALSEALAGFGVTQGGAAQKSQKPDVAAAQGTPPPKTVSQVLGEITWLMTQSPRHKSIPLGDLEWMLMPAILLKQFRIFYKGEQPVGVAVWALADDEVAKRIDANEKRLTAVEWKSGTNMRIIDIVAPFGGEAEMRGQVERVTF